VIMAKVIFSDGSKAWANNLNDLRERWHLRREEPIKFVVPTTLFKKDLTKLDRDELMKFQVELIELLNQAKKTMLNARMQKRYEDTKLERDAYTDLDGTIRAIGAHIQEVNFALSRARRQSNDTVVHYFMEVCRERLSKEMWNEFMDEAQARLRRAHPAANVGTDINDDAHDRE
jgi:hypothetical protein